MKLPRLRVLIALAILVVAGVGAAEWLGRPGCAAVFGDREISISSSMLRAGEARFFCYRDGANSQLRFVLARGSDGQIRSAMDACAQCYKYHKGFTASGGELICRLCGNRYRIDHMMAGKASCVPVSIRSSEQSGHVKIDPAELKRNGWLF